MISYLHIRTTHLDWDALLSLVLGQKTITPSMVTCQFEGTGAKLWPLGCSPSKTCFTINAP